MMMRKISVSVKLALLLAALLPLSAVPQTGGRGLEGATSGKALPSPSSSTLGGVKAYPAITHQWLNAILSSGTVTSTRPSCADLSDGVSSCSTDTTNASNIASGTLAYARLSTAIKPAVSTIAVGASITLPNPTSVNQTAYVTGAAGTVLSTVTTSVKMPASPIDQGTVIVTFDAAQVPAWTVNTGQSFPTGAPPQLLMQPGSAIRFVYDGSGTREAANSWYWDILTSADGGLYSSSGVYQTGTMASAVQTLEGEVTSLQGTTGDVTVTAGPGTATFDTGANIPKLDANNAYSGTQTFNNDVYVSAPAGHIYITDTAQSGTNISNWDLNLISGTNGKLCLSARKDDWTGGTDAICFTRGASGSSTGQGITTISFGNSVSSTVYNFLGLTATFTGNVKAPMLIATGGCAGVSGQSYVCQPNSSEVALAVDSGVQGFKTDANKNSIFLGPAVHQGSLPVITCITNCVAQNAGVGSTVTFTGGGSAVINGTSLTFAPYEAVVLTDSGGSLPAAFTAGVSTNAGSFVNGVTYVITSVGNTNFASIGASASQVGIVFTATGVGSGTGVASTNPYYVNSTGVGTTTFQLCAAPPTITTGPAWTACTSINAATAGTGTITATGYNNYVVLGGTTRGIIQLPPGTWSGAPTLRVNFSASDPAITVGISCFGNDLTAITQLTNSSISTTYCNLVKATAPTALDWWSYSAGGF